MREYSPRWQQVLGTTAEETFAALYEDPVRLRRFTQLMDSNSILQGQVIASHIDFTPYQCLMDVSSGPGRLSITIGRHYPHLQGMIMDVPAVCQIAEEHISAAGLTSRFTAVPADLIHGPYPSARTSSRWDGFSMTGMTGVVGRSCAIALTRCRSREAFW